MSAKDKDGKAGEQLKKKSARELREKLGWTEQPEEQQEANIQHNLDGLDGVGI